MVSISYRTRKKVCRVKKQKNEANGMSFWIRQFEKHSLSFLGEIFLAERKQ